MALRFLGLYHCDNGTTKFPPRNSPLSAFGGGSAPRTSSVQTTAALSIFSPEGIRTPSAKIARRTCAPASTVTLSHSTESLTEASEETLQPPPISTSLPVFFIKARLLSR